MTKLSREELAQIVAEQMPAYVVPTEVLDEDAAPSIKAPPEATTPEPEFLREKYLGTSASASEQVDLLGEDNAEAEESPESEAEVEDTMVIVHPRSAGIAFESHVGPKAVIVSGSTKEIIGVQG